MNNPIIYKFFKDFTNHRKKTNRAVVFSSRPFPNIKYRNLNTGTTDETFQESGKKRLLKTLIGEFSYMSESSGSQFFRTIIGIK